MSARRSWSSILSIGCTLMFSGAAYSFAQTLLQTTQKKLDVQAGAVNRAGFTGGTKVEAGEAPKSIPVSATSPVKEKTNSLANLENTVTRHSVSGTATVAESFAKHFGLSTEEKDRKMTTIGIKGEGKERRGVMLRRRDKDNIDIFLVVVTKDGHGYYYQTSADGNLIQAAVANGRIVVIPNKDAKDGFEKEMDFWQDWATKNAPTVASTESQSSNGSSTGGGR